MKLYATPLSHFSRKIRILLDLYGARYDVIDVGNVAEGAPEKFGNNPLCRVPVLVDEEEWIIDSDRIAEIVARKFDPEDQYKVQARSIADANIREVLNGIMAEEVTVIIARRTGVPTDQYRFFQDALETIDQGLAWLEKNADQFDSMDPGFKEFHLVCAWEHLAYYDLLPLHFERLKKVVERVAANPVVRQSSPWVLKPKV
jgi:glutathione S-transferase